MLKSGQIAVQLGDSRTPKSFPQKSSCEVPLNSFVSKVWRYIVNQYTIICIISVLKSMHITILLVNDQQDLVKIITELSPLAVVKG